MVDTLARRPNERTGSCTMIVALILAIIGLTMGIAVVQWYGLRLSGVLAVPLFAVYTLYDLLAIPVFVVAGVAAYIGVGILRRRTFCFGRQLLLAAMAIGAAVPLLLYGVLSAIGLVSVELSSLTVMGSIMPGVAAYNFHQLDDRTDRIDDLIASVAAFVGLVALGAALINISFAPHLGRIVPPFLFTPEADVAALRRATIADIEAGLETPPTVLFAAFAVGIAATEGAYHRYGVRLAGIIAMPLLALFSLQSAMVVPLYVAGTAIVYATITTIHRRTLLYGRVLLGLSIVVGLLSILPVAIVAPLAPGIHLFFTGVLTGIGAYNLHRVPSAHRPASVALSTALFVSVLGWLRFFVQPSPDGALSEPSIASVGLCLAGLAAGALALIRLERLTPPTIRRAIDTTGTRSQTP
ncbi:poly-gamma-glutamate biosynthesis protein PgsC/CapC [Halovivax limisalsi]|uniref:poly-gamma-glutamate biosynthesis protein PgsC/CapC n=1 Tax=Halovivax limisalsi TaxID=1453760 RepID=UPI001FFDA094|nr:poly-gamma-glutamate biosynthesis protein PgsC/CapC [Halovivax limisalsi]